MRMFHLRVFTVLAAFFLAAALCPAQGRAASTPPRLGIALPSVRENRWLLDLGALQKAAEARGVNILVRFAGNDQRYQNLQIQEMLIIGIDALILAPEDGHLAAEGAEIARSMGVPVISYDRLVRDAELDAYVTFDQLKVGELQGEFLATRIPHGNYILISGPPSDGNAAVYKAGSMKHLQPLIDSKAITVLAEGVADQWKADVAGEIVRNVLAVTSDVDAVLAPNDDTAGGVIEALKERHLEGRVLVTGQDATKEAVERIRAGIQSMTVFKNTEDLAAMAMDVALALLEKQPLPAQGSLDNGSGYPVPTYEAPVTLIDKTRLYWLLRQVEMQ